MALQMKPTVAQQVRRPSVAMSATSPAARTPEASKRAATKATRAPSAYNLYVKEHYQSVSARLKAKGLPADLTNVGKHLRQQWSALSDREKAPYAAKSQKLKEEIAGTGSRSTSPVAARGVARASSASIRPVSPGASRAVSPSARGQRPATPQPTTKPLPPYEAFITEQFPAVKASHANASAAEITKLIEEMWARVPQAQKDAKALRYKAELAAYMSGSGSSGSSARTSPQPTRSSAAPRSYSPAPAARAATPSQRPSPVRGASASKPLPPFEAFTQDQFAVIKSSNPKASTNEISRMIDDLWSRVPQSTKDAKQKRYEAELAAYNSGNNGASRGYSPAPARTSSPASRSYSPAPAARAASPRPSGQRPETPRAGSTEPLPPFEAFSKEQYLVIKATYPKAGDSEINRMISDMWNKLPSSLKDAKEARYKADLAAFKAGGGSSSAGYSSRTSSPARSYSPAPSRTSTPSRAASPRPSGQRPETPRGSSVASEPLPPFEAFSKEQSQVIKATYPKASQGEVDRMINDMWSKLPSSLKDAKEARYRTDLAAFRASGGSSSAGYSSSSRTSSPARSYSPAPASRSYTPTRAASPRPSGQRPETPRAGTVEPLPPYEAFLKEQSQVIKATYPKASQGEVDRMISDMWNKLPSSLKDAKEARYKADLAAFRASGGSSSAGYSSSSRTSSPARSYSPAPASRSYTPTRAASPRPSGQRPETPRAGTTEPLPPYEAFLKEQSQVIKATYPKASQGEVDRMISDMWNKLPSSLKDAKEARYRADLAAYNSQNGTNAAPRSSSSSRSNYSPAPTRSYSPAPAARAPTPSQRPSTPRGAPTTEPLPPFEAFSKEQYQVIKASHPKSSDHEINRLINELWARVPQAQKDAKQKRYETDLSAYRSGGGSSAAPRSYSPAPAARSYSPAPARTVSPRPTGQRPQTPRAGASEPLPPFEAFAKEQSSVIKAGNPRASDSEINRMVSDLWSRVPQSTKDAKQKRYEAELAAYNQSQGGSRYSSSSAPRRQTVSVRR